MKTSAVITENTASSSEVSSPSPGRSPLLQIIEQALTEGYVTRSQQKSLLLALFLNQPLTSEEFKRLRKVCYHLQTGNVRVLE